MTDFNLNAASNLQFTQVTIADLHSSVHLTKGLGLSVLVELCSCVIAFRNAQLDDQDIGLYTGTGQRGRDKASAGPVP